MPKTKKKADQKERAAKKSKANIEQKVEKPKSNLKVVEKARPKKKEPEPSEEQSDDLVAATHLVTEDPDVSKALPHPVWIHFANELLEKLDTSQKSEPSTFHISSLFVTAIALEEMHNYQQDYKFYDEVESDSDSGEPLSCEEDENVPPKKVGKPKTHAEQFGEGDLVIEED